MPGVHRGADRGRGVRGRRGPGVRRRRPRHRDASTRPRRAAAVTDRTRAVIPVHLYGRPALIPDLGVPVVEDAAQAHGALDPGVRLGSPRRTASIPTKNLGGIGDGGAVVTDDDDLAATLRLLRAHGVTDRLRAHAWSPPTPGCPRSPRPRCGSGCAALDADNARRREIAARYRAAAPALRWQADHARHVYHLCVARVPDRDDLPAIGPVRHRSALPAGAHPAARLPGVRPVRRARKPSDGRRSAYRCRASPR